MAMLQKEYLYKVYKEVSTSVTNGVFDGDFEGEVGSWSTYWQAFNTGPTLFRNRQNSFPSASPGNALSFNGVNSCVAIPGTQVLGNDLTSVPYMGVIQDWYKSNWADGVRQALFSNDYVDPTATSGQQQMGFGVHLNYTPGFLSAVATTLLSGVWTLKEAKVATSTLAAGWHDIGANWDGTTLTLYVDGASVATATVTGSGHALYYGNSGTGYPNCVGVGAQKVVTSGTNLAPSGNWALGICQTTEIHSSGSGSSLTSAQVLDHHTNHTLQVANNSYSYNFDFITGSTVYDLINSNNAIEYNCTTAVGIIETTHALAFTTATSGSTTQGIKSTTLGRVAIVGGATYYASCWVKGTVGQTANLTITPIGGGAAATFSQVLVSGWNRLALPYTFNVAATSAEIDIYLSAANASIKTLYVDQVMLETGSVLHNFFNRYTADTLNATYGWDNIHSVHTATIKSFQFITTWSDVVSTFTNSQEIDAVGGEVTVTLQRNPETADLLGDLALDYQVQVYVITTIYPNGSLYFTGTVSNYKQSYSGNNTEVVLFPYASDMSEYLFEGSPLAIVNQFDASGTAKAIFNTNAFGSYFGLAGQSFYTAAGQTNIGSIDIYLQPDLTNVNLGGFPLNLYVYQSFADFAAGTNPIASCSGTIPLTGYGFVNFPMTDGAGNTFPISVLPSTKYFWTVGYYGYLGNSYTFDVATSNGLFFSDSFGYTLDQSSQTLLSDNRSYTFRINQSFGQTAISYASADPSQMLMDAIDDYQRQGGQVIYDSSSIEMTGLSLPYDFNGTTLLDVAGDVLSLCPAGWYWYVDQATLKFHLHPATSATIHTLVKDKHFADLVFEKSLENVINTIYFTGGEVTPGVNFFKKYQDANSVALYGQRLYQYNDSNVIEEQVADPIAATLLQTYSQPTIQTTPEIIDSTFNIELPRVGDFMIFRGFNSSGGSLWDVDKWDQASWDFDLLDPQTFKLQLVRLDYNPDSITPQLATNPPDINKEITDLKRAVQGLVTIDNPDAPTS